MLRSQLRTTSIWLAWMSVSGCHEPISKSANPEGEGLLVVTAPTEAVGEFSVETKTSGEFERQPTITLELHVGETGFEYLGHTPAPGPAGTPIETYNEAAAALIWPSGNDELVTNWSLDCGEPPYRGEFTVWWGWEEAEPELLAAEDRSQYREILEANEFQSDTVSIPTICPLFPEPEPDPTTSASDGSTGLPTGSTGMTTDALTTSGGETGMIDPPARTHLYPVSDDETVVQALAYMPDDTVEEMVGVTVDLVGPAATGAATHDGGGVYFGGATFGGTELSAFARDRTTGELTPVGDPYPIPIPVYGIATSATDDRLFITYNNVMSADVTQFAIGGDYGLAFGSTFIAGEYAETPATGPAGDLLYQPYSQGGGGLITFELADIATPPMAIDTIASGGAGHVAVGEDGDCLYLAASSTRAYAIGVDGVPSEVGRADPGSSEVFLAGDGGLLVVARAGASGSVEVVRLNADCSLGESAAIVDSPLGLHRHSNLLSYGDASLLFEFSASGPTHALLVDGEGNLTVGDDFMVPGGTRAIVALPEQ